MEPLCPTPCWVLIFHQTLASATSPRTVRRITVGMKSRFAPAFDPDAASEALPVRTPSGRALHVMAADTGRHTEQRKVPGIFPGTVPTNLPMAVSDTLE
jgi:hypothetical protein